MTGPASGDPTKAKDPPEIFVKVHEATQKAFSPRPDPAPGKNPTAK